MIHFHVSFSHFGLKRRVLVTSYMQVRHSKQVCATGRGGEGCALHPNDQNIFLFSWVLQIPLQLFMVGGQHGGHGAHALEAVAEDHKSGPEHAPTPLQEMVAITAEDQTLKEGDATQRDAPVY